jgi:hypothetical protein
MNTCASCRHWLKLGTCATPRRIIYDSMHVTIPAGEEGQCRALPPPQDLRWPLTMGSDGCGCHTLTEATTPLGRCCGGEPPEPPAPDTAAAPLLAAAAAEGGKGLPPVKPAAGSPDGGRPSLLQRILPGRGHGRKNP